MKTDLRAKVKEAAREYLRQTQGKQSPGARHSYIPVSGKVLGEAELDNMIDATLDMWLTAGRFAYQFESEFARLTEHQQVVLTNSGSSANLLAFSALTSPKLKDRALKPGDEVISVATSFPSTVSPIFLYHCVPVFVDCELETYNIDVSAIEVAITPKTKAIFLAHTLGNPFALDKITELAHKYRLWLIEDCCDALGARFQDKQVGTFGDLATFSFYPAHHITMGEGGAVAVNDPQLYRIVKSFRDWGRDCACPPGCDNSCGKRFSQQLGSLPFGYDHKYTYSHLSFNLKVTDWQAACGCAQLKRFPEFLEKRTANASYLQEHLADLSSYLKLPKVMPECKSAWFGFLLSVYPNEKFSKQKLTEYLEQHKIGTRQLFAGNILRQPMIADSELAFRIAGCPDLLHSRELTDKHYALLPNSDFVMNNTFWIGTYPGLNQADLEYMVEVMHGYFGD